MKESDRWNHLIANCQIGRISDEDFAELEEALRNSEEARSLYHRACRIDSRLRREAENCKGEILDLSVNQTSKTVPFTSHNSFQSRPFWKGLAVAAAVVLLTAITWAIAVQHRFVATLVSSENAAWESSLPTEPGSKLTRGGLRISSGIATIHFDSGVELTLEAPARLFLKGPRKAKLISGTAVVNAGGSEDFSLETDYGQAVVQRGEYIAFANPVGKRFSYEVISGAVQVGHDITREAIRLSEGSSASLLPEKLKSSEEIESEEPLEKFDRGLRIRTNGRVATFIRNNKPRKWTRPELLTLKTSNLQHGFDQRSVVGFDLSKVKGEKVGEVTLQLNLVPSGSGLASRLPKVNRFAVYGLVNDAKADWAQTDLWEDAPAEADGIVVGRFEIPRSQQSGAVEIRGPELSELVRDRAGSSVTFILVRETANAEGAGHGLVHAIASDYHPEAAGPVLEILLKD